MEGMEKMILKKQKRSPSQKKGSRLLPYVPTSDPQRRLEQMASLAAALTSIGLDFSDSLSYGYAPRTANRSAHEKGGMRVLRNLHALVSAALVPLSFAVCESLHAAFFLCSTHACREVSFTLRPVAMASAMDTPSCGFAD